MKISDMIRNLYGFLKENGDLECWYAADDEGNEYRPIYYLPSLYYANKDNEVGHSIQDFDFEEDFVDDIRQICVIN